MSPFFAFGQLYFIFLGVFLYILESAYVKKGGN